MTKLSAVLTLAMVVLSASVLATPVPAVHDLHATSLDLYALEGEDNSSGFFAIRVERTDKIVDLDESQEKALAEGNGEDVDGTLLAARVADVIVMFNVSPQGQVSIDGNPVPLGMSNVKVEADVQTGVTAEGEKLSAEQLTKAWDRGLVGMKVLVESNQSPDGVVHLTISEMVTEVNGKNVVQRNVLQQAVDVQPDGTLTYRKPCHASPETSELMAEDGDGEDHPRHGHHGHHGHGRKQCLGRKFSAWFRSLGAAGKVFFAVLLGMSLGVIASAVTRILVVIFRPSTFAVIEVSDETAPFITKVSMEEADEKLPIYDSNGYAGVATDDKKESQ